MNGNIESDNGLEQFDTPNQELAKVYEILRKINLVSQGKLDICPLCGAKLTSMQQGVKVAKLL